MALKKVTKRITIDLDRCSESSAKITANLMKKDIPYIHRTEIYKSAGGKGYHVIAYLIKEITYPEQFKWRERFWDCPTRLKISKMAYKKGLNPDILFTSKRMIDGTWKNVKKII